MSIPFVFSNRIKFRLARHIAFWTVMVCYQLAVDLVVPTLFQDGFNVSKQALLFVTGYLPGQFILVYALLYFIIPKYFLRSRFLPGIAILMVLLALAALINFFSSHSFNYFPTGPHSFGITRVLAVACLASFIRITKFWYETSYRTSKLEKAKLAAELQVLKAQIHPHFLFNTLNNIYSITQNTSPEASDMLLRLSALLRYILYECNQPEIRLGQEFKIINNYILLERVRYGKSLDVNVKLAENVDSYFIAPLLLLPLIDNCFKHGTSKTLDEPWINIQTDIKENILSLKLMNSRPEYAEPDWNKKSPSSGIGLSNLKKRLEFLYPGKHELKILPESNMFVVVLKIELRHIVEK